MTTSRGTLRALLTIPVGMATLGAMAVAGGAPAAVAAPAPIVVALEAPLTGPQASNGIDMYRGAALAVQRINANGGVLGRQIKLVKVDDKADPGLALAAARTAKAAGAVAVIGPYNSSVGLVNLPFYLANGITPVQLTSTDATTRKGVTVQPKDSQISPVEVAYMSQSSGCPKVVMLVDPSAYTQGMADRVGKAMMCDDDAQVASVPIVEGRASYVDDVANALAMNPDILYVSTYYPEGSKIATAIGAATTTAKCLMGLANVDPAFVTQAGIPASQRCVFSGVPAAAQLPSAKSYTKAYRAKFSAEPGVWGTFTYDSADILAAALRKAGTTASKAVLANLLKTKGFAGQTGSITIDPRTGNRTKVPVSILRVNDAGVFVINS